ncbi:MAG: hypothetical protein ACLUI3_00490 [Christensenellales bacterium]
MPTITGDHENRVTDYTALAVGNSQLNQIYMTDTAGNADMRTRSTDDLRILGGAGRKGRESATRNGIADAQSRSSGTTRCPTLPIG